MAAGLSVPLAVLLVAATSVRAAEPPPGDPVRGRAIVGSRQTGLCLLCHTGPFPDPHLQGSFAPDLRGVGSRLTPDEIRRRLVDPRSVNPDSLMPAYLVTEGRRRVAPPWRDRPVLTAAQIEDVVAFLVTLRDPPP